MIPKTDFSSSMERLANGNVRYTNAYSSYEFTQLPLQTLEGSTLAANQDRLEHSIPNRETIWSNQITAFKPKYMEGSLAANPKTRDAWRDISSRADVAIGNYMDGTMSEDELASTFQSLAHEMYEHTAKVGYPLPFVGETFEQSCTEAMYDTFRQKILSTAVQRNRAEGMQYVTGEMCPQRTWKYYNADYYYKSEAAITAITRGMEEFAQNRGWTWNVPDYKGLNLYYNFNTAFSNDFCLDEQHILNPDMVPPQGFEWFYQTGGYPHGAYAMLESMTTTYPDGTQTTVYYHTRDQFNPEDPFTATTWAAFTDKNGVQHRISKDIIFQGDKRDLFCVGDLLHFDIGEDSEVLNAFLNNLQLYPKNYFRLYFRPTTFDCSI